MEILRIDGVFLRLANTDGVTTRTGELATLLTKKQGPSANFVLVSKFDFFSPMEGYLIQSNGN